MLLQVTETWDRTSCRAGNDEGRRIVNITSQFLNNLAASHNSEAERCEERGHIVKAEGEKRRENGQFLAGKNLISAPFSIFPRPFAFFSVFCEERRDGEFCLPERDEGDRLKQLFLCSGKCVTSARKSAASNSNI